MTGAVQPVGRPAVILRPMRVPDIAAVERIEAASLPHPWPAGAFRHELEANPHARYVVAALAGEAPTPRRAAAGAAPSDVSMPTPAGGDAAGEVSPVVGFAGLWMQFDEAHLSLMAVAPAFRRHGIGARLVARMLEEAMAAGAACMTLEVRAGNVSAQRLYARFGFAVVGERRAYYPDNDEDALIMTTPPLGDRAWRQRFERIRARLDGRPGAGSTREEDHHRQPDEAEPGGEHQVRR